MAILKTLKPASTALVMIDLQRGILARQTEPRPASEVLDANVRLADAFRDRGGLVVCVHVSFGQDGRDRLAPEADEPTTGPLPPPGWDEIAQELRPGANNTIVVTKRNWGAFYGTDLDLQLRRRGCDTIVLTGISTNFGVESTGRDAYERGYRLLFVEDAMAGMSADDHNFPITRIFPRIGRVVKAEQVLDALNRDV